MAAYGYLVNHNRVVVATAITIIQIKAGAAASLDIADVQLYQTVSETSQTEVVQLVRKTGAATVTSFTPLKLNAGDPTAAAVGGTSATGITGSAEGTDGDVLDEWGFNVLNGVAWVYIPELRVHVAAAGIIGVKFPVAPTSATWTGRVKFLEQQ